MYSVCTVLKKRRFTCLTYFRVVHGAVHEQAQHCQAKDVVEPFWSRGRFEVLPVSPPPLGGRCQNEASLRGSWPASVCFFCTIEGAMCAGSAQVTLVEFREGYCTGLGTVYLLRLTRALSRQHAGASQRGWHKSVGLLRVSPSPGPWLLSQ